MKGKYKGEIKGKYEEALGAVEKNKELAMAYSAYESELEKSRLYDFEDMIIEVTNQLSADRGLLLRIEEEHHYVLADEHQTQIQPKISFWNWYRHSTRTRIYSLSATKSRLSFGSKAHL